MNSATLHIILLKEADFCLLNSFSRNMSQDFPNKSGRLSCDSQQLFLKQTKCSASSFRQSHIVFSK